MCSVLLLSAIYTAESGRRSRIEIWDSLEPNFFIAVLFIMRVDCIMVEHVVCLMAMSREASFTGTLEAFTCTASKTSTLLAPKTFSNLGIVLLKIPKKMFWALCNESSFS